MSNRAYDVVVWGATGFTYRLVVEYITANHSDTRLAVAARNEAKCKRVLTSLGLELPIIIAEAFDESSLRAMVSLKLKWFVQPSRTLLTIWSSAG